MKRWKRGDWLLVGGVLALGGVLAACEWHGRGPSLGTILAEVAIAAVAASVGRVVS
jgi:hypothetical protein